MIDFTTKICACAPGRVGLTPSGSSGSWVDPAAAAAFSARCRCLRSTKNASGRQKLMPQNMTAGQGFEEGIAANVKLGLQARLPVGSERDYPSVKRTRHSTAYSPVVMHQGFSKALVTPSLPGPSSSYTAERRMGNIGLKPGSAHWPRQRWRQLGGKLWTSHTASLAAMQTGNTMRS